MKNNPYMLNVSKYSAHTIIQKEIGRNKIVLDVGCNDGYMGKVADQSNHFYGLDYLEQSVKSAKEIYEDAAVFDLNNLQLLPWDKKFDVIIFADVLEHILFPEKALKFFVDDYLNDGGMVIVSLPNVANWQVRIKLLFGNFDYTDSGILDRTHLHLYTFKSACELVEKNGWKVSRVLYGASFFHPFIKYSFGVLKNLLATNIILICKK